MILFLPAAGGYWWYNNQWSYSANEVYLSGRASSATRSAGRWQATSTRFTVSNGLRQTRNSVRLATVVSGLAGDVVLFLPAAGNRPGGKVANPGLAGFCRMRTPGWYSLGSNSLGVAPGQESQGFSVRLATVVSGLAVWL